MNIRSNEKAVELNGNDRVKELCVRLADYKDEDLVAICRDAYSWDGSFEKIGGAFPAEEIGEWLDCRDMHEILRSIVNGNVTSASDMLRFNAYGNLESVTEWKLAVDARFMIEDIAEWLMDGWHDCYSLYTEDEELLEAWEKLDSSEDVDENAGEDDSEGVLHIGSSYLGGSSWTWTSM